jgi:hypothetical protein
MKKYLQSILVIQFLFSFTITAQWTPISTGLGGHTPTSMYGWPASDVLWLGTMGGGIFKSLDNGNTWNAINGNLANLNVNDIRPFGTGTSMFVATEGGPFHTMDEVTYINCTTAGLTHSDINFFWYGHNDPQSYFIGTNGGGVFLAPDFTGPWTAQNNGLSGDGLIVNDIGGYADGEVDYAVMASNDGVYFADSTLNPWTRKVNGLAGPSLKVNNLTGLGSAIWIATDGGLFMSPDLGENWNPLVPFDKFNTVSIVQTSLTRLGLAIFAFGVSGYYSFDFVNYNFFDLPETTGEVTCFALTTTDIVIGIDDGTKSGSVYRHPVDVLLDAEDEFSGIPQDYNLEQNYPNPFNPSTRIKFAIPKSGIVVLSVYNLLGQKLEELVNEEMRAGNHTVSFDGSNLSSGTYFYKISVNGFQSSKKMIVLR